MDSCEDIVATLVKENSKEDFLSASGVLIKFAENILNNPNEPKYRKIRIGNPAVQSKLLNSVGAMECLFLMGFEEEESGEYLTLPPVKSLQPLRNIRDSLIRELSNLEKPQPTEQTQQGARQRVQQNAALDPSFNFQIMASEAEFADRIRGGMTRVLQYEKPSVQEKARQCIPVETLQSEAESSLETAQAKGGSKLDIKDFLLTGLLKWFKYAFFKWVDTLPCCQCGGKTQHNGGLQPSNDDLRWGASRVEAHRCKLCEVDTRFPRYTNAEKLLETRRGRCGEWADCFTLCCRALGFEARFVMDWTDHVWTEVYSNSRSRWLHCDPCENVCDKPLLYESGWGKKLTYAIAVSKDEVQDVTWRYSAKHKELLSRRRLCREQWLRRTIHSLWRKQIATLPQEKQKEMWTRLLCELTEFIAIKADNENLPGRSTGSLEWRQARGELGNQAALDVNSSAATGFVFTPTENEKKLKIIHVQYNCSTDKYLRRSSGNQETRAWDSCVFSETHVARKEESDWKMVYLAKTEGSSSAEITWKFDLTNTDLKASKLELKAQTAVFENGKISWKVCADDRCSMHTAESVQESTTIQLQGDKTLTLTAMLKGGKGDNAWQHTQLFRQPSADASSYPLDMKLVLV